MVLGLGIVSMGVLMGQATGPAGSAPATRVAATRPVGVMLLDENGEMRLYPTNLETIKTVRAGVLNLCAEDIPRYTQTGPAPVGAMGRLGVISPGPHDGKLPTIWTIGDSTVRTGVSGTGG